jgi:PII-like signaling protein
VAKEPQKITENTLFSGFSGVGFAERQIEADMLQLQQTTPIVFKREFRQSLLNLCCKQC